MHTRPHIHARACSHIQFIVPFHVMKLLMYSDCIYTLVLDIDSLWTVFILDESLCPNEVYSTYIASMYTIPWAVNKKIHILFLKQLRFVI